MAKRRVFNEYMYKALRCYFHPDVDNYSKKEIELLFITYLNHNITFKSTYLIQSFDYHVHSLDVYYDEIFYNIIDEIDYRGEKFIELKILFKTYFLFNPACIVDEKAELFLSENDIFQRSLMKRGYK